VNRAPIVVLLLSGTAACATASPRPLTPETAQGIAAGPAGKVLVISASCGSMQSQCRPTWSEAVDGIVVGGLEFHGYSTIDPSTLRKDAAERSESTVSDDSTRTHTSKNKSTGVGLVGMWPVIARNDTTTSSISVSQSKQKTVVVTGATFEDLPLDDRRELLRFAGAESVLSTRLVVGANYHNWSSAQFVEVMVKLSAAADGSMRWATRCVASSSDFASVEAAIDAAARCAAGSIAAAP
jgi:hypothetical protein